jgi:hypothetical protein
VTINEALQQRVPRVRLPHWASPRCYLRLPLLKDGMHGPWAELYDDDCQEHLLKIRPGSQRVPMFGESEQTYEPYTGPPSRFEQHPEAFSRTYEES